MKFLDGIFNNKNVMPLNIYYDRGTEYSPNDDILNIVYKDMETGKKYVQSITNPDIEIWICKKEYRNEYSHIRNFMEKTKCYSVTVKYKTRYKEIAKLLNVTQEQVKLSPYVFGIDVNIEHFYMMNFITEYNNRNTKKLNVGYLDIETDIISIDHFPEPGEVPINAVTFIDESRLQCYTLLLKKDDVPRLPEGNPKYQYYEKLRNNFQTQVQDFEDNIDGFVEELHQAFDASYGELNYNILMFDKEIDLINALFQIIHASDNDFICIWNLPFDMQNLIERPKQLGYDPSSIIVNKAFGEKGVFFKEDTNALVHKRKHICNTYTMPTFIDQMVIYAGVRIAKGKLPSTKLNAIARIELKDSKLDYTEEGNIRFLPYTNYKKFVMYNIKDVLLQMGINRKTRDIDTIYATIYTDAVLPHEVFTSTTVIANSLRMFVSNWKCGYVMGTNKNKLVTETVNQINKFIAEAQKEDYDYDSDDIEDEDDTEDDESESQEETTTGKKKKDKFQGAYVMNPLHMLSTGYKILGSPSKYVHVYVVDMDIGAEYPTSIIIMNSSNETMVGKFHLENPDDVNVPIYNSFNFIGKEKDEYKLDKSNFVLEIYSQGDMLNVGKIVFNLPEPTDILDHIEENLMTFKK